MYFIYSHGFFRCTFSSVTQSIGYPSIPVKELVTYIKKCDKTQVISHMYNIVLLFLYPKRSLRIPIVDNMQNCSSVIIVNVITKNSPLKCWKNVDFVSMAHCCLQESHIFEKCPLLCSFISYECFAVFHVLLAKNRPLILQFVNNCNQNSSS